MRQNRGVPGRRLILVLVMLLVTLSVLSAGRDISRRVPAGQTTTPPVTGTTPTPAQASSGKDPAREKEEGGPGMASPGGAVTRRLPSTEPVRARLGQRVVLRIETGRPDILIIDELGLRAPTGPGTGATLDFVAGATGSFPITLGVGGKQVGELKVSG